jgi:hypothetical protein
MGFFDRFSSSSSFQQSLILRLLDQNQALLDRLLEKEGIETIGEKKEEKRVAPSPDDPFIAPQEREKMIESLSFEAAADPDLLEQARYNARSNEDWREVVERAESLMNPSY